MWNFEAGGGEEGGQFKYNVGTYSCMWYDVICTRHGNYKTHKPDGIDMP
jgi:hypothetical protein